MLLDTHIFLWWLFDDPKLPSNIKNYLQNLDNSVFISTVSVWEITTKFRIGKLPKASSIAANVPKWIIKSGFQSLSITPEHAQLAGSWEIDHRDPFDRMLAAQSSLEHLTLATTDKAISLFPIEIFSRNI
ncbi:MAG: type II toxin-antitoxin system VapC family toxin [Thermodesulfobacteriota bacterium]|nr:type II toxin-antitoxin system VapC family toxin [Thermodesulfobacteriota bacterium]MEA1968795.1 type II toxin-antitoxin system VapC family toxin [Thermodesulfobacteriota bacterium]